MRSTFKALTSIGRILFILPQLQSLYSPVNRRSSSFFLPCLTLVELYPFIPSFSVLRYCSKTSAYVRIIELSFVLLLSFSIHQSTCCSIDYSSIQHSLCFRNFGAPLRLLSKLSETSGWYYWSSAWPIDFQLVSFIRHWLFITFDLRHLLPCCHSFIPILVLHLPTAISGLIDAFARRVTYPLSISAFAGLPSHFRPSTSLVLLEVHSFRLVRCRKSSAYKFSASALFKQDLLGSMGPLGYFD